MTLRLTLAVALAVSAATLPQLSEARDKGCPPGYAKHHDHCQASGHANGSPQGFVPHFTQIEPPKKHSTWNRQERHSTWKNDPERDVILLRRGDRVDNYHRERLYDERRYGLPPLRRGEHYEVINGQIVRVDENTATIMALIGLAQGLLQ